MIEMKYLVWTIFAASVFGWKASADTAIAEGLARVALLHQGFDPDQISEFAIDERQRDLEIAFGYYDRYQYTETATFQTTSGPVKGAKFNESYAFYSIPFAKPPVRFQPPEPISTPLAEIDATYPDIVVCQQLPNNCTNGVCTQNTDEDCLVLNVHVPPEVEITDQGATTSVRPVLFWLYGGGFFTGGGTIPEFEARWMAEQTDAVIVTTNYRVGAFGFLVHGEGENAIKGNMGLKDQQLALKWVHDNIEKFGGDPEMVTIFGNSAGAQSVMFHLVSAKSKPYFKRAIMQSNPAVFQYQTIEEAKRVSNRLVRILNCSGTVEEEQKCLMEADPLDINRALLLVMPYSLVEDQDLFSTVEAFRPVLDGGEFKQQPLEMFRDGTWHTDKDVIIGTNTNELEMIQYYIPSHTPNGTVIPFPRVAYELLNRFLFGNETGDMVSERYINDYGLGIRTDYRVLLGIEASHMFFMCPSRLLGRFASNSSTGGRIYMYNNGQAMDGPTCPDVIKPPDMCGMAFHGAEPPFIFRSGPFYGYDFREPDTEAANQFSYYWTNFATTGNPSQKGSITGVGHNLGPYENWPEYSGDPTTYHLNQLTNPAFRRPENLGRYDRPYNLVLYDRLARKHVKSMTPWQNIIIHGDTTKNTLEDGYLEEICDFWDSLNYYIDLSPAGTERPPPPDETSSMTTKSSVVITTSDVGNTISTTSASARMSCNIYEMLLLCLLSMRFLKF